MLHKEFWGMLFLAFVAWVFLAGAPAKRIENVCAPVGWVGNAVVSLSALAMPNQQEGAERWFNKFEYGCRYLTWRLFYQEAYNRWLLETQRASAPASAASSAAAASAAASSAVPATSGSAGPVVAPPARPR